MDPVSATVLIGAFIIIIGAIVVALIVRREESGDPEPGPAYKPPPVMLHHTGNGNGTGNPGGMKVTVSSVVPPGVAISTGHQPGLLASPDGIDVENLRTAWERASYEPTGVVLHPRDYDRVRCDHEVRTTPGLPGSPSRVEMQKRIADAFGIPYWIAGVDGVKPPLRVRVRRFRRSLPGRGRRLLARLPLVYDYGYVARKGTWLYDGPTERRGRWWVQVGPLRIGWGWDEE